MTATVRVGGATVPLDVDLGDALAAHLLADRGVADLAAFEAAFVALVESADPDADTAWDRFYDATLARLASRPGGDGTLAVFSRIWARARGLARGDSVLDVGSCFGWLPLAWAGEPGAPRLLGCDLSPAAARLAARQGRRLGRPVAWSCADGTRLPLADAAVDTVLLLHVLEHVPVGVEAALLAEAQRVAARRVVVAVPVEPAPDPVFGHLQVFDTDRLAALGRAGGWSWSTADGDGAWLVLDRPETP